MKLFGLSKIRKGFTLIEIVIAIAILTVLSAITIVAINPARQFAQANNVQRRSDISSLLKAIFQYSADNYGLLPAYINSTSTQQIGSSTEGCAITCGATTTVAACVNLDPALVPTYLVAIPYDPRQANASSTHYAVTKSLINNRLTVIACDAELGETIQNPNIGAAEVVTPFSATGGTITTDGLYTIHTFTSSGTFTVTSGSGNIATLIVGGGGGGGATIGGGGGGGGLIYNSAYAVTTQAYVVTVGNGGSAGTGLGAGAKGGNSVFSNLTAIGGGGGAGYNSNASGTGGSAGGNGASSGVRAGYTVGQGNDGGAGSGIPNGNTGGGGGGAGAVGASSAGAVSGNGGVGLAYSISGVSTYYAGGGGGGYRTSGGTPGTGGNGGGGNGGMSTTGFPGTANTGGGGGGGGYVASLDGGAGGSGIVIIRYLTP